MKFIHIPVYTLVLFLLTAVYGFSQGVSYRGNSAANFLKVDLSAKSVGMAEANITNVEDASCLNFNVGGISRLTGPSVSFSYVQWLVETSLGHCAITMPTEYGTVGLDVSFFNSGDMEETTLLKQDGTGKFITASDVSIGLSYGRNLTDRFSVGLKAKYIHEDLAAVSASAFAFDVGSIFETSFLNNMKIGISLSNFGSSLEFNGNDLLITHVVNGSATNKEVTGVLQTNAWDLPMFFQVGASTYVMKTDDISVLAAYCLIDSRDYGVRQKIGSEVELLKILRVRGGYRFNYDEATFSFGAGVKINAGAMGNLFFDYAYSDYGTLKGVNQISLGLNF